MKDLEVALTDLADHLDVPDTTHSADALARRLAALDAGRSRRPRVHALRPAAAAIAVVCIGVAAIAPARDAVAGWLGIGSVEVRRTEGPLPTVPSTTGGTTGTTSSTRPPVAVVDLAAARRAVQFEILTPRDAPEPTRVSVDRRVPGGLVVLTYDHFTLVEVASVQNQPPTLAKLVGDAPVEHVTVNGREGLWIASPHRIAYLDRNGNYRPDTIRRTGPVLMWERDGVTYRVEGPHTMDEAMTIANTIV